MTRIGSASARMKVGVVLPTADGDSVDAPAWGSIRAMACQAEGAGVDSLWICDHLIIRAGGQGEEGVREAWTTLSALAAVTSRTEIGTLVTATPFRPPGLLAKMAATVDEISGGRLILGLGCGWHEPELRAFGYDSDQLVSRFEEALAVITSLIHGHRLTHRDRWSRLDDAVLLPSPQRPDAISPRIPVLVAAIGPRMLRITARHADAWNTNGYGWPDELFQARLDALHRACEAEGRDPSTIEVTAGIQIAMSEPSRARDAALAPDPSAVAAALAAWEWRGVHHVQVSPLPMSGAAIDLVGESIHRLHGAHISRSHA